MHRASTPVRRKLTRTALRSWSGLLAGTGFAALILMPRSVFSGSVAASAAPLMIAICLLAWGAVVRGRSLQIPLGFWVFSAVALSGFAGGMLTGLLNDLTAVTILGMVPLWFLAGNLSKDERVVATGVVVAAAVTAAVLTIADNLVGNALIAESTFPQPNPLIGEARGQGTLSHPLVAAFVFAVVLAVVLRSGIPKLARFLISALLLWGIFATGSSSAAIVAVGAIGFVLMTGERDSSRTGRVLLVAAVGIAVASAFPSIFSISDDLAPESNAHRVNSLLAVPRLIVDRPFAEVILGSGWSAVRNLYDTRIFDNDGFYAVDNQFVAMLAFGGVVGLVAYVALVVGVLARAREAGMRLAFTVAVVMGLSFDTIFSAVAMSLMIFVATAALGEPQSRPGPRAVLLVGPGDQAYQMYGVRQSQSASLSSERGRHDNRL